jgi:hypothetical protein
MKNIKYNLINGPKQTVGDYLERLNNDELKDIYSSSFFYDLKMPDLVRKIQNELQKRKIAAQPALF